MWGIGFIYNYNAHTRTLDITHARGKNLIIAVTLDELNARNPRGYAQFIEKTAQIKAMILSNNETVNLVVTLEPERLHQILTSVIRLAELAFDLKTKRVATFCKNIQINYDLHELYIKRMACQRSKSIYYKGRLKTKHGNETTARAPYLQMLLRVLSEQIIQDILPHEYSIQDNSTANLLTISSKMALLSRILDPDYVPHISRKEASDKQNKDVSGLI